MLTSKDRILTTHVGSLIRPKELVDTYLLPLQRGEHIDEAGFQRELKRTVADVVKHQERAGVDVVSDGETDAVKLRVGARVALAQHAQAAALHVEQAELHAQPSGVVLDLALEQRVGADLPPVLADHGALEIGRAHV